MKERKLMLTTREVERYAVRQYEHIRGDDGSKTLFPTRSVIESGCWESNPVYTHPKRAYYRYTTPRSEEDRESKFS